VIRKDFGMLLLQLNEAERGLELLAEAAEIAAGERKGMRVRRDPEVLRQVARVYMGIDRADLALPHLERLAGHKGPHRPVDILADLANARYFLGRHEEAVATMKEAAAENPRNPALLMSVAQMYDALNRPAEAQSWAKRAEELQRSLEAEAATNN
jgi:tetratricopeptide (TPR) repeat protein